VAPRKRWPSLSPAAVAFWSLALLATSFQPARLVIAYFRLVFFSGRDQLTAASR
jgi:hypothetical protein